MPRPHIWDETLEALGAHEVLTDGERWHERCLQGPWLQRQVGPRERLGTQGHFRAELPGLAGTEASWEVGWVEKRDEALGALGLSDTLGVFLSRTYHEWNVGIRGVDAGHGRMRRLQGAARLGQRLKEGVKSCVGHAPRWGQSLSFRTALVGRALTQLLIGHWGRPQKSMQASWFSRWMAESWAVRC